jgi:homoserine O-acetyltransferase
MGGMLVLEWPLCVPTGYVRQIIPITTSAFHSAWGIAWGQAQRQCIYADSDYRNGHYEPVPTRQPGKGMGTARMVAMLTYRSHISFESRFGRKQSAGRKRVSLPIPPPFDDDEAALESCCKFQGHVNRTERKQKFPEEQSPLKFSAQSYLQYQADKFLTRYDANCYIHLTTKMDTHDVTRSRILDHTGDKISPTDSDLKLVFQTVPPGALVISVATDVLFRPEQQIQLADSLPDATFLNLDSSDGHDGFLLESAALGNAITRHLRAKFPMLYAHDIPEIKEKMVEETVRDSLFGEAESEY